MERIKRFFRHVFVPNESNSYRAKILQPDFLTVYLVVAVLMVCLVRLEGNGLNVLGIATDIKIDKLLNDTNEERQKNNLAPLTYNEQLSQAAAQKANDMFANNYWAHYSPSGKTPWEFILASGYTYEYAGENLAKNFLFSEQVVDAWMASETHRENLLKEEFAEVGYAVVNGNLGGEETTLVVQMFGTPTPGAVAVAPPPPQVAVLAQSTANKPFIELQPYYLYIFMGFLALTLLVDFYVASRLQIFRIHGKNIAHLVFLLALILGMYLFLSKGSIV